MKKTSFVRLAILTVMLFLAPSVFAAGTYSNIGDGSAVAPYQIATAGHMQEIGTNTDDWDKYFILTNNINLAAYTGTSFNIIGNPPTNFTGSFDGDGHTIDSFTYTSTGTDEIGLFSKVGSGGEIKNLGLTNVNVNAGTGDYVGSLVGRNTSGSVTNCYSTGSVDGGDNIGGLMGENGGPITNSYSTGSVSGSSAVGGMVGGNYGDVTNCYSTSSVDGTTDIGGLIGVTIASSITNCYSTGSVSGSSNVGGMVGINMGSATNSFWDTITSETTVGVSGGSLSGIFGKETDDMQKQSTYTGWDFIEVWNIGENQTYPFLIQYPTGDLNHDGRVDMVDFTILAKHWLEGTAP